MSLPLLCRGLPIAKLCQVSYSFGDFYQYVYFQGLGLLWEVTTTTDDYIVIILITIKPSFPAHPLGLFAMPLAVCELETQNDHSPGQYLLALFSLPCV